MSNAKHKQSPAQVLRRLMATLLAAMMLLTFVPAVSLPAFAADGEDDGFYRILHLDCGRKYFTKDWIVALINEMSAAGYNQLQLAFGNDGLRFLLDDMSFTANGTTYSHSTVVSKVEAGNMAQNSSDDARWLNQTEMDEIITYANSKGIEIVPLLNLPGHANAILDIAEDKYNASGSNNTLDVADSDAAVDFGYAIFVKYVDYFKGKGCNFFNFGADEYANDASGTFSFSRLNSTQYQKFVTFINKLSTYIEDNGMTPRSFNDGLYYNGQSASIDTSIQCCYWSSGWVSYPVAAASTIANKGHAMINTNGDYYYVLGKDDKFDSDYSYASGFSNSTFMGSTISNPVGSMFCIWCDYPNAETETEVAQKTRLVLRAKAARMQNKGINTISTDVVTGGFNADGTVNYIANTNESVNASVKVSGKTVAASIISGGKAVLQLNNVGDKDVTVSSSNDAVATAEYKDGKLTVNAVAAGEATITVTVSDTVSRAADPTVFTVNVTVTEPGTEQVQLTVGETKTFNDVKDVADGEKSNNTYIATANVKTTTIPGESKYTLVDSLAAGEYYVSTSANDTAPTVKITLEAAGSGTYYIKNSSGDYIYPNASYVGFSFWGRWSYSLGTDSQNAVTVSKSGSGYTFSRNVSSGNENTTSYLTLSGSSFGASGTATTLYLYKQTTTVGTSTSDLTITGTGEGTTAVTVGETTYNITVKARETTANQTLTYNNSLPLDGYEIESHNDNGCITVSGNTITAGTVNGTATVVAVKKNTGGYVTDRVTYTITVTKEDLDNAPELTIEYWITNAPLTDAAGNNVYTLSASAANIYSENGVLVSTFLPAQLTKENRSVEYWRCRLLDTTLANTSTSNTEKQTDKEGDDDTCNGTGFTKVRYYNSAWAVYTEDNEWVTVDSNKHQLVAYYMEVLPIADELYVNAADWGKKGDGSSSGDYLPSANYCTVTVRVVYEDGTINPAGTTATDLKGNTIVYGYWEENGRGVGTLKFTGLEGYQIYKIEAETGASTVTFGNANWGNATVSSFTWDNNAMTIYEGDPVDSYIIHNDAKSPSKDGFYENLMWDENYEAILLTVYVKAQETDDTLKVVYYDEKFSAELYSYYITVGSGVNFTKDIVNSGNNKTSWSAIQVFTGSESRKNVAGYGIVNTLNVTQWFETDLTKVPEAKGKYHNDLYKYEGSTISEDGTTLYLFYTINTEVFKPNLVVDFGLPVTFGLDQIVDSIDMVKKVTVNNGKYGSLSYDEKTKQFTYTPTTILLNYDVLAINILFDGEQTAQLTNVGITPASTVYYEEGFITATGWDKDGSDTTSNQTTTELGKANGSPYGYDDAYNSNTGHSGGSAYKVTVDKTNQSATASFTFTGDKFDLISVTGKNTGSIFIQAKSTSEVGQTYTWFVDTYYGNTVDDTNKYIKYTWKNGTDGKWHVTGSEEIADLPAGAKLGFTDNNDGSGVSYVLNVKGQDQGTLYQIPVISKEVAWGTYEVTVKAVYYSVFDHTNSGSYDFYIDGVRIYNTLQDSSVYAPDGENDPVFTEIRDILIDDQTKFDEVEEGTSGAVFIDGFGTTESLELYEAYGPNNEVYLKPGQAIAFIAGNGKYFIGAKSPDGGATMVINGNETSIDTATDMYYAVTPTAEGYIVVANNGTGILSLTTIKAVGSAAAPAVYSVDANVVAYARTMVLDMIQPAPAFEPATLEAEWTTFKLFSYSTHTLTVRTSDDVEYITVGDREIRDFYYTLKLEGSGWNRKLVKYKVFTLVLGNDAELGDYTITAYNAAGNASAPKTAALSGETWFDKFN